MDRDTLQQIYRQSAQVALPASVSARITSSTLSAPTLQFIDAVMKHYQPKRILEFGSGLSTQFFARYIDQLELLVSVDHSAYFLAQAGKELPVSPKIKLLYAPISRYFFKGKAFATYHSSYLAHLPIHAKFDLVLIDGPNAVRFGREAPLYQIRSHLHSDSLILLDDSTRSFERSAVSNWQRVWANRCAVTEFPNLKKGLAVIQITDPANITQWPFSLDDIFASYLALPWQLTYLKATLHDPNPAAVLRV